MKHTRTFVAAGIALTAAAAVLSPTASPAAVDAADGTLRRCSPTARRPVARSSS